MPISAIDGCSREHWKEVKDIISEAISASGYEPNLVSNADDSGIIQQRIIQNLYNNDIVVCDVSGKNPNVMFELGMRLAFDKPTIIIIDDKTDYSFDTSPIEHLSYPRDLKYYDILKFKDQLKTKIVATIEKAKNDPHYTTFLKNFGEFEVAHVEKKAGSIDEVILSRLDNLSQQVQRLNRTSPPSIRQPFEDIKTDDEFEILQRVHRGISKFIEETGISMIELIDNKNNERRTLQSYLENDQDLCMMCRYERVMQKAINGVLSFYEETKK